MPAPLMDFSSPDKVKSYLQQAFARTSADVGINQSNRAIQVTPHYVFNGRTGENELIAGEYVVNIYGDTHQTANMSWSGVVSAGPNQTLQVNVGMGKQLYTGDLATISEASPTGFFFPSGGEREKYGVNPFYTGVESFARRVMAGFGMVSERKQIYPGDTLTPNEAVYKINTATEPGVEYNAAGGKSMGVIPPSSFYMGPTTSPEQLRRLSETFNIPVLGDVGAAVGNLNNFLKDLNLRAIQGIAERNPVLADNVAKWESLIGAGIFEPTQTSAGLLLTGRVGGTPVKNAEGLTQWDFLIKSPIKSRYVGPGARDVADLYAVSPPWEKGGRMQPIPEEFQAQTSAVMRPGDVPFTGLRLQAVSPVTTIPWQSGQGQLHLPGKLLEYLERNNQYLAAGTPSHQPLELGNITSMADLVERTQSLQLNTSILGRPLPWASRVSIGSIGPEDARKSLNITTKQQLTSVQGYRMILPSAWARTGEEVESYLPALRTLAKTGVNQIEFTGAGENPILDVITETATNPAVKVWGGKTQINVPLLGGVPYQITPTGGGPPIPYNLLQPNKSLPSIMMASLSAVPTTIKAANKAGYGGTVYDMLREVYSGNKNALSRISAYEAQAGGGVLDVSALSESMGYRSPEQFLQGASRLAFQSGVEYGDIDQTRNTRLRSMFGMGRVQGEVPIEQLTNLTRREYRQQVIQSLTSPQYNLDTGELERPGLTLREAMSTWRGEVLPQIRQTLKDKYEALYTQYHRGDMITYPTVAPLVNEPPGIPSNQGEVQASLKGHNLLGPLGWLEKNYRRVFPVSASTRGLQEMFSSLQASKQGYPTDLSSTFIMTQEKAQQIQMGMAEFEGKGTVREQAEKMRDVIREATGWEKGQPDKRIFFQTSQLEHPGMGAFLAQETTAYDIGEGGETELTSQNFAANRGLRMMNDLLASEASGKYPIGLSQSVISELEKSAGSEALRKDTGGMYEKIVGTRLLRAGEAFVTSWGVGRWAANQGDIQESGIARAARALNSAFAVYSRPPYVTTGSTGAPGSSQPLQLITAQPEATQKRRLFRDLEAGIVRERIMPTGINVSSATQSNLGDLDVDPGSFFPFAYRNAEGQYRRYNPQGNRREWFEQMRREVSPEAQQETFNRLFGAMGSSMNPFQQAIREAFRGGGANLLEKGAALGIPGMGPATDVWNRTKQRLMGSTFRAYKSRAEAASAFLGAPERFSTEALDTLGGPYAHAVDFRNIETSFQKMIQSSGFFTGNRPGEITVSAIKDLGDAGWKGAPTMWNVSRGDIRSYAGNVALTLAGDKGMTPEALATMTYNMPVQGEMGDEEYSNLVMGQWQGLTERYRGAMGIENPMKRNAAITDVVQSGLREGVLGARGLAVTQLLGRNLEYITKDEVRNRNMQEMSVDAAGNGLIRIGDKTMDWQGFVNQYKPLQWLTQFAYGKKGPTEWREPGNLVQMMGSAFINKIARQPLVQRMWEKYAGPSGISNPAEGPVSYIVPGSGGTRATIETEADMEEYRRMEYANRQALQEQRYPTTGTTVTGQTVNRPSEEEQLAAEAAARERSLTPRGNPGVVTPLEREAAASKVEGILMANAVDEFGRPISAQRSTSVGGARGPTTTPVSSGNPPSGTIPPSGTSGVATPGEEPSDDEIVRIYNAKKKLVGGISRPDLMGAISGAVQSAGAVIGQQPSPAGVQPMTGATYNEGVRETQKFFNQVAGALRGGRGRGGWSDSKVDTAVATSMYRGFVPQVREQIGTFTQEGEFQAGAFTQAYQNLPESLAGLVTGEAEQARIRGAGGVPEAWSEFLSVSGEQGINVRKALSRIPGFQNFMTIGKRLSRHAETIRSVGAESELDTQSQYYNTPDVRAISAMAGGGGALGLNALTPGQNVGTQIETMMSGFKTIAKDVTGIPVGRKGQEELIPAERSMLGETIKSYSELTKEMENHIRTVTKYKGSMTDLDQHLGKMVEGNSKRTEALAESMKSIEDKELTLRKTGIAISKEFNLPTEKGFLTAEQIEQARQGATTSEQGALIEKYSRTEAEVMEGRVGATDIARGKSPLDKVGRASRMMLGGFGLMYLRSIWDIMTGPGTTGYQESMAFQGAFEQGYGSQVGGITPQMTPQMRIQRAAMMQGGPTAMALQSAQAGIMERAPAAWNAIGLGQAAVGGAGVAAWITQGMLGMEFAAAAPWMLGVGGIAAAGAAGLQYYGATQDYMGTAAGLSASAIKTQGKSGLEQFLGTNIFQSLAWGTEEVQRRLGMPVDNKVQQSTAVVLKMSMAAQTGAKDLRAVAADAHKQVSGRVATQAEIDQYMTAYTKQQASVSPVEGQFMGMAVGMNQAFGLGLPGGPGSRMETLGVMLQQGIPVEQMALGAVSVAGQTREQQFAQAGQTINQWITEDRQGVKLDLLRQQNINAGTAIFDRMQAVAPPIINAAQYSEFIGGKLTNQANVDAFMMKSSIQMLAQQTGRPFQYMTPSQATNFGLMNAQQANQYMYAAAPTQQLEQTFAGVGNVMMQMGGSGNMAWTTGMTQMQGNQLLSQANFGLQFGQQLVSGGMGGARANAIGQAFPMMSPTMFNMYQGMANMNPLQWSAYALQNPGLVSQLPQTMMGTGNTPISNRFMFAADIGAGGLTGMPWGTTSLAFPDQVGQLMGGAGMMAQLGGRGMTMAQAVQASSRATAAQVWTGGNYGASGQGLIAAITQGGTMGGQAYQMQQQAAQASAQAGIQLQQLELQAKYQPQFWAIQDQMRNLGYAQQEWGFGQQEQQLAMNQRFFNQNMGIQQQQMTQQRQWTREDWQYQSNVRGLQWGWKQEDFGEEVRFMTGRTRRLAERQMGRETTLHDMEDEQITKQRQRQQETWALEDKRFQLQKQQNQEQVHFQEEAIKKQREFFEQRRTLENQQVKLEREYWQENYELQLKATKASAGYAAAQAENAKVMQELSNYTTQMMAEGNLFNPATMKDLWQVLTDIDPIFASYIEKLKEQADIMGGGEGGGSSGTGTSGSGTTTTSGSNPLTNPDTYTEGEQAGGHLVWHWNGHVWKKVKESDHGNYLEAGELSSVNESGLELFRASVSGDVIPLFEQNAWNSASMIAGSGGRGGQRTNVTINIGGQHIARFIMDLLKKEINV